MKAIERVKQYIDYKGFNNSSFEKEIELSNGYIATQLKRNADLGEGILNKILNNCLDINPEWLLTGKGSMLKSEACGDPRSTPVTHRHQEANSTESLEQLRKENAMQAKIIEGLEFKVNTLEKELSTLKQVPKDPILYKNVAEPAPELIKK